MQYKTDAQNKSVLINIYNMSNGKMHCDMTWPYLSALTLASAETGFSLMLADSL